MTWSHDLKSRLAGCILLVCLALGIAGCASVPADRSLDLHVVNLQLRTATAFETTAVFTLRAENESPEPITLTGGVFKFSIDGRQIGKGMWNDRVELQRLDSSTFLVEVHLSNLAMATRVKGIAEAKATDIRTEATLFATTGGSERRIRLVKESRLDSKDFTPTK